MTPIKDQDGFFVDFWAELYNAHEADEFEAVMVPAVRALLAQAWDEGHRFTGYEPGPGENPYHIDGATGGRTQRDAREDAAHWEAEYDAAVAKIERVEALLDAEEARVAEANARLEAEGRNVHPVYGIKWGVSGIISTRRLRAALTQPPSND